VLRGKFGIRSADVNVVKKLPPRFDPSIFTCQSVEQAKRIILTTHSIEETEAHWQEETPLIANLLIEHLQIRPEHTVLDFGCGIGRLAQPIISKTGCKVVGVDISASMRQMSIEYVASSRFRAHSPEDAFADESAATYNSAYSVPALQHCEWPGDELRRIHNVLVPSGRFMLINSVSRFVPTDQGWGDDGVDVLAIACELYVLDKFVEYPLRNGTSRDTPVQTYCALFHRP
jgi:SAM-dependent methyltransferase